MKEPADPVVEARCPSCGKVGFESGTRLASAGQVTIRKKCDRCKAWWWLKIVAVPVASGAGG